jgi:hypothetical protein
MSTSIITIVLLGLVIFILLLSPFFSRKLEKNNQNVLIDDLQEKENVFSQLSDLEYDYQMGKLSEQDHTKTKTELMARAAKFVVSSENNKELIQSQVDREIESNLNKHGLKPEREVGYDK